MINPQRLVEFDRAAVDCYGNDCPKFIFVVVDVCARNENLISHLPAVRRLGEYNFRRAAGQRRRGWAVTCLLGSHHLDNSM